MDRLSIKLYRGDLYELCRLQRNQKPTDNLLETLYITEDQSPEDIMAEILRILKVPLYKEVYVTYIDPKHEESDKISKFLAVLDFSFMNIKHLIDQQVSVLGLIEKPQTNRNGNRTVIADVPRKMCYQYLRPQHVKVGSPSTYQDLLFGLDVTRLKYMNVLMYIPNDEYSKIVSVVR
ncbi:MAG: hypothetical protein EZS28_051588, partial [Streblomastix strix]